MLVFADSAGAVPARIVVFRQEFPDPGKTPVAKPCQGIDSGEHDQSAEQPVQGQGREGLPDCREGLYPPIDMVFPIDGVQLVHEFVQGDTVGSRIEIRGADVDEKKAVILTLVPVDIHLCGTDRTGAVVKDLQWIDGCVGHFFTPPDIYYKSARDFSKVERGRFKFREVMRSANVLVYLSR